MICSMSTLEFYRFYLQTWYTYKVQDRHRKLFPLQTDESDSVLDWPLYVRGTAPPNIHMNRVQGVPQQICNALVKKKPPQPCRESKPIPRASP